MAVLPQQAGNTAYNIFKHSTVVALLGIMRQRSPWTFITPYAGQPRLVSREHLSFSNQYQGKKKLHPIHRNGYKAIRRSVLKSLRKLHQPDPGRRIPYYEQTFPKNLVHWAQENGSNSGTISYLRALLHYNDLRDRDLPLRNAHENWSLADYSSKWFWEKLNQHEKPDTLRFPMTTDLARMYMRPIDRAILWDRSAVGLELLHERVGKEKNFSIYDREVYRDWDWLTQFKENNTANGLCVIDFPIHYLQRADMMHKHMDLIRFLQAHCPLWTILITYPISGGESMRPWVDKLGSEGKASRIYRSEVYYKDQQIGIGAALINPPTWGTPMISRAAHHIGKAMRWGYREPLKKKANFPPIPRPRQREHPPRAWHLAFEPEESGEEGDTELESEIENEESEEN